MPNSEHRQSPLLINSMSRRRDPCDHESQDQSTDHAHLHPYSEGEQLTTVGGQHGSHVKVMIILDSPPTGAVASTGSNYARGVRVRTIRF